MTLSGLLALPLLVGSSLSVPRLAQAEDIPKYLLLKLTRDQSRVFCSSEVFTQCMGFSETQCIDISEKAIEQCLGPLPAQIDPLNLDNDVLEQCPQQVYAKEGFSEEKAKECYEKAVEEL